MDRSSIIKAVFILLIIGSLFGLSTHVNAQPDTVLIKNYNNADYQAAGLNYTGIKSSEGHFYFANENGVLRYDGSRWQLIPIKNFAAAFALAEGHDGRIYVGSINEFGYLKESNKGYTYVSISENKPKATEEIWQIIVSGNNVYFASYQGFYKYDGANLEFIDLPDAHIFVVGDKVVASQFEGGIYEIIDTTPVLMNEDLKMIDDAAYAITPTIESDKYILMTSESGIYQLDTSNFKLSKILTSSSELNTKGIYDAAPVYDSLYAVATWYGGLYLINRGGEILMRVDKNYGLSSNETRELFIDQRGHIWVTTIAGISHLYWESAELKNEFKAVTEIQANYSYKRDSSISGVAYYFSTPGYESFEIEYKYYLDGFEDDFPEWSKETKKEYTNLDGGKYEFKVKARLPNGTETEVAQSNFYIPTPWYLNMWLIGSAILFVGLFVFVVYRIRTKRLKNLNLRLEKIIVNRTEELVEQREQLKMINKELKITNSELDNFVYRSSHDLVAPLKSLRGLVNLARIEDTNDKLTPYLDKMDTSVLKLEEFIKSIMEYSTNTKSELRLQKIPFDGVINSITEDLRFYKNADKIKLIKNYNPEFSLKSDIKRLHIVLSNLITNCIKYHNYDQENPFIEVGAKSDDEKVEIIVKDNGLGIDEEHLKHIFNMFYRASENGDGSGLGLYIVQDTLEILNGGISVKSKVGKGTTFTILLPPNS
ncbi:MAG: ATP-binding protein [Fulvivirga sp.]